MLLMLLLESLQFYLFIFGLVYLLKDYKTTNGNHSSAGFKIKDFWGNIKRLLSLVTRSRWCSILLVFPIALGIGKAFLSLHDIQSSAYSVYLHSPVGSFSHNLCFVFDHLLPQSPSLFFSDEFTMLMPFLFRNLVMGSAFLVQGTAIYSFFFFPLMLWWPLIFKSAQLSF